MAGRKPRPGRRSLGRFRATAGPRAARSVAPVSCAVTMSSSDDEVDRVADLDLMSQRFTPLEPGKAVRIADMPGRLRSYELKMSDGSRHAAVGIAVSRRCDLLVAVAQGTGAAAGVSRVALDFLATDAVTKWMTSAMGGR